MMCKHNWGPTLYDPINIGSDRCCFSPPSVKHRWKRFCTRCGIVEMFSQNNSYQQEIVGQLTEEKINSELEEWKKYHGRR